MELADNDPFGPIDDEGSAIGHGRQVAEVNFLLDGIGKLVASLFLGREPKLRLQGYSIRQSSLLALDNGVLWLFDLVFHEFQQEVFPGVHDREVHLKDLLEAQFLPPMRRSLGLQESVERVDLNVEQIGNINNRGNSAEGDEAVRSVGLVFQVNRSFR